MFYVLSNSDNLKSVNQKFDQLDFGNGLITRFFFAKSQRNNPFSGGEINA